MKGANRYLAEIRMPIQGGRDLTWIGHSLRAACRRLEASHRPHVVGAGYSPEDGRLLCIVQAANAEDVCRLLEIALLPSARILDVIDLHEVGFDTEPG